MRFRELIKPVTGGSGPLIQHLSKTCHFCILQSNAEGELRWKNKAFLTAYFFGDISAKNCHNWLFLSEL